ncbi:hypothetical protein RRG08_010303 [Elysia crispata]|uniref:Uncharacterized protein n=1 Tax=Elysia crispata TaxID=231223 RepID=A0AAE1D8N6_9GAST|nr:hypothetical protein RRG08_010303 [Elysia crispata]
MVIAPEYLLVVRKSMMTYLTNALMFNVHYKDIGHTNLMHLTAFPIYPLEEEHPVDAYPLFVRLFENTQAFNGGYVKHCASAVVTALLDQHPFVTRRDFDLTLTYFVLTGAVQLSRTVCRSYLFKGSYNPLADVYKSYLVASKISRPLVAAATPKGVWAPYPEDDSAWFLSAPTDGWSRPLLLLGLKFGDGYSMQHWTPGRIKSFSILCDRAYNPVHYPTIAVTTPKLIARVRNFSFTYLSDWFSVRGCVCSSRQAARSRFETANILDAELDGYGTTSRIRKVVHSDQMSRQGRSSKPNMIKCSDGRIQKLAAVPLSMTDQMTR